MRLLLLLLCLKVIDLSVCEFICNNESLKQVDSAMAIVLNNGGNRRYPESRSQVKPYCDEIKSAAKYIEDYKTKCMHNLPKQLTSITVYTIKSMVNNLCRKDSKRLNRLLSGAQCANTVKKSTDGCHNRFIDALLGIRHAEHKLKIPFVCCEYHKIYHCMRNTSQKSPVCTEERIEATVEFTRDLSENTANFLCGEYTEDSDKCQTLPKRPNKRKSQMRTKSFLWPLIDIFQSFPDI